MIIRALGIPTFLVSIAFAAEPVKAKLIDSSHRSPVPTVRLPDATGKIVDLAQFRGKVVLIDFWATWCGGCKEELPRFADFENSFKHQGLSIIAVSMDEGGWTTVTRFVRTHQMPGIVLLDDGTSEKQFAIQTMPVALLIDRQGRVAARYVGVVDSDNFEANIRSLIGEQ